MIYLIYRSLGSISRSKTPNLSGLVIAPFFSPQSVSLRHSPRKASTFSSPHQDLSIQMAKNKAKNIKSKGIKRKGPKTASIDSGKSAQPGQDQRMSQRNNYQSDQARDRLESAVWNQQQNQQAPAQQQIAPVQGAQGTIPSVLRYDQTWGRVWNGLGHQLSPPGAYGQWTSTPSYPPNHTVYSNTGYSANPAHNNYNNYNNNIGSAPARRDYSTSSRPGQKPQSTNHQLPPDRQLIPNDQLPPRPEPRPKSLHLPPGPNLQYNNPQPTPKQKHRPNRSHHRKPPNINDRDTILSPSAKSGGVPNPTPSYLLRASFLPIAVAKPRPILVVIDLNGTMLFRPNRKQPFNFIERPNARNFLGYCISTFTVVIWSSARPENVEKMCSQLLTPEQLNTVVAIWGRDKFGLSSADYNARTMCYKRLATVWGDPDVAASHPSGEHWNQGNTVLIDDTVEKARSEPYNAITLPEFQGDVNEEPAVLPMVHDYLNTLSMQADISTYIRANPFKLGGQETNANDDQEDIAPAGVAGI